jgi:nucleoside-diphosphate-sugar epimerase
MRVFVTGSTGFIGSAIVDELRAGGHEVLGFARSEASAGKLAALGVEVLRGDLTDTDSLVAGVKACDGTIHTAFIHDFSDMEANARVDLRAIEAMTAALEGSNKPFVATSGTALLKPGHLVTENDPPAMQVGRAKSEGAIASAATRGVRASMVRLAPTVHGAGDHGFVPMIVEMARRHGHAAYIEDGANRWPAVHRLDAAHLFCLALERAEPGARLHGAAEEGVPFKSIAETIGAGLGIPVRSLSKDEAAAYFGWMAMFAGIDNPTSSAITRSSLGWQPQQLELLPDMRANYFGELVRS